MTDNDKSIRELLSRWASGWLSPGRDYTDIPMRMPDDEPSEWEMALAETWDSTADVLDEIADDASEEEIERRIRQLADESREIAAYRRREEK